MSGKGDPDEGWELAGGVARLEFEMRRAVQEVSNGWKLKDGSGQNLHP